MPYVRVFYHVVWATRDRQSLIREEWAASRYGSIADKAIKLGATVHAVGGIEDHVHLAVSVPPGIALSEFIGQLKGSSSHFMNHKLNLPAAFGWQAEYGLLSFDNKQLPGIVRYIKEQRQHHHQQTTIRVLERLS